jgi:GT2 family glycosyltransferase
MSLEQMPVSAVVPTMNRSASLLRTFESLVRQSAQPREIIVVDASDDASTREICAGQIKGLDSKIIWQKANEAGAATQRNEGMRAVTQPFVWFFDDDILFEANCVQRLWSAIDSDRQLGGANAMIINQRYQPPGLISRTMFTLMHGRAEQSFAGKIIGPAINLLPEDRDDLPELVPVEWLNTTCTIYRREALPSPVFDSQFSGYSFMEDVTLSLRVAQAGWRLANARDARIYHDSQVGSHKDNAVAQAEMQLVNRYYVMTRVVHRTDIASFLKLILFELFGIVSSLRSERSIKRLCQTLRGKQKGVSKLLRDRESDRTKA